ncbi:MAG: glycoside hydrolase family 57 protein [Bryobacteraceae bacterium]
MAKIYLCFLWHMHQPYYKDLASGEYRLPWTRLHALKDYRGMVRLLEEFPDIRQTFNVVPSLMVQIEDYASGQAQDPFLRCALKPAEELTEDEQRFILQYFFQANPARMIYRYPRYGELFDAWRASGRDFRRARHIFTPQAYRDLQVLSQIAWFDEDLLRDDPVARRLAAKGRGFTLEDQAETGRIQTEYLASVIPTYREFAGSGQIEISTTPFYHPILPLLCDSSIAEVAHPNVPLPTRFRYPQDARLQLERARDYVAEVFGQAPAGLWPSEGSVSDEVLGIAAETGFHWLATDNGVLARTLGRPIHAADGYRPYLWSKDGRRIHVVFRDHFLSDLVGFVYSRMDAAEAAADFLHRILENCAGILAEGRAALVPVILDGENAWEYYEQNGRPFLRELYRLISADPKLEALTISEALARLESDHLGEIFPGSWINANFDIWIGSEEDNQAWEYLLRARQTYDRMLASPEADSIPAERRNLALEEILIAEGSDWCWWYGPEHTSENRPEFDKLFRDHLAMVYRALGLTPPEELSRPILKVTAAEYHRPPSSYIQPVLDGEVTSFFEWLGAGVVRVDGRSGAMHGGGPLIKELRYGCDGTHFFLRVDFEEAAMPSLAGMEVRVNAGVASLSVRLEASGAVLKESAPAEVQAVFGKTLEISLPLEVTGTGSGDLLRVQLSLWHEGLPLDAVPHQGWLECPTAEPAEWPL